MELDLYRNSHYSFIKAKRVKGYQLKCLELASWVLNNLPSDFLFFSWLQFVTNCARAELSSSCCQYLPTELQGSEVFAFVILTKAWWERMSTSALGRFSLF